MDKIYTPEAIVHHLIEAASDNYPRCIADFASGMGNLLKRASNKWPNAEVIATDIDKITIRSLKRQEKSWQIGQCDFLNKYSRRSCHAIAKKKGTIDLIILNPPFSCRGAKRFEFHFNKEKLHGSKALTFIGTSLEYLSNTGLLISIIPLGSLHSEKDSAAWQKIKEHYDVNVLMHFGKNTFQGHSPNTAVISLQKKHLETISLVQQVSNNAQLSNVEILRGTQQVHKLTTIQKTNFIHTTNLETFNEKPIYDFMIKSNRPISGNVVLVPRVGAIRKEKLRHLSLDKPHVLSDCVFGLIFKNKRDSNNIHKEILKNFELLKNYYSGTGAPFLTLKNLKKYLLKVSPSTFQQEFI